MHKNKTLAFIITSFLLLSTVIMPVGFITEDVKADDLYDYSYPVSLDLKVGFFPKGYDLLGEWGPPTILTAENFNTCPTNQQASAQLNDNILAQLDNIEWYDAATLYEGHRIPMGERVLLKMVVNNQQDFSVGSVSLSVSFPGQYMFAYKFDSTHQTMYSNYDGTSATWNINDLSAYESFNSYFYTENNPLNGIAFTGQGPYWPTTPGGCVYPFGPFNLPCSVSAKITSANGFTYTDFDYGYAPHISDTLDITFSKPTGLLVKKHFSYGTSLQNFKQGALNVGDNITVRISAHCTVPWEPLIVDYQGVPTFVGIKICSLPMVRIYDYVPPFLEVTNLPPADNGMMSNMQYHEENHTITYQTSLSNYPALNPGFQASYEATVISAGSMDLIPVAAGSYGRNYGHVIFKAYYEAYRNGEFEIPGPGYEVASDVIDILSVDWTTLTHFSLPPAVGVSPFNFNFGEMLKGQTDQDTLNIWNYGGNTLSYSIAVDDPEIIDVTPIDGTSTGLDDAHQHILTIDTTDLPLGEYASFIHINDVMMRVSANIVEEYSQEEPILEYTPKSYDFELLEQNDIVSTSFDIYNDGTGLLEYALSESYECLELDTLTGDSSGEHDTINVELNTIGLSPGIYSYNIDIASNNGSGVFTVDFEINESENPVVENEDPILAFTPHIHDFGQLHIDDIVSASFNIYNDGAGILNYTLSESYTCLELDTNSGNSTGEYDTINIELDTNGLTPDTYSYNINIESNNGSSVFAIYFSITSNDEPPEDPVFLSINRPEANYLYLFDSEIIKLTFLKGLPLIIGPLTIEFDINTDIYEYFEILIDGELIDTCSSPEYKITQKIRGKHTIEIKVYNSQDILLDSDEMELIIYNFG